MAPGKLRAHLGDYHGLAAYGRHDHAENAAWHIEAHDPRLDYHSPENLLRRIVTEGIMGRPRP
jgi:hypothetical protein